MYLHWCLKLEILFFVEREVEPRGSSLSWLVEWITIVLNVTGILQLLQSASQNSRLCFVIFTIKRYFLFFLKQIFLPHYIVFQLLFDSQLIRLAVTAPLLFVAVLVFL